MDQRSMAQRAAAGGVGRGLSGLLRRAARRDLTGG